jgi:hypothetical protein
VFWTSALDEGEWLALRPGLFTPRKDPLVPIGQEAGWAPGHNRGIIGSIPERDSVFILGIREAQHSSRVTL